MLHFKIAELLQFQTYQLLVKVLFNTLKMQVNTCDESIEKPCGMKHERSIFLFAYLILFTIHTRNKNTFRK